MLSSVAARRLYMVLNFVNVLTVAKYYDGIASVSREEYNFGYLFCQGLQSSTLFGSKVVRRVAFFDILIRENCISIIVW